MILQIRLADGDTTRIELDRPPHVTHGTLVWVTDGHHQHFLAPGQWVEAWTEEPRR